jgi:molybdopterin-guanine dinucleotide biosynthesis protein A
MTQRAVLILAGGMSVRMKRDKALLDFLGEPLILRVIRKVKPLADEIMVSISRRQNIEEFRSLLPRGSKLIQDVYEDQAPMIGIYSGMHELTAPLTALLSCDLPFVSSEMVEYLFESCHGYDAVAPRWPSGIVEPLHAVYRTKKAAIQAKVNCEAKRYKNLALLENLNTLYVPTDGLQRYDPELRSLKSVNTPEEYEEALRIARSQES